MATQMELIKAYQLVLADLQEEAGYTDEGRKELTGAMQGRLYELTVVWEDTLLQEAVDTVKAVILEVAKNRHPAKTGHIPNLVKP